MEAAIPSDLVPLMAGAMGAYVLLLLVVGWWTRGQVDTTEDYVLAGRRLGLGLATPTLLATWFGAGTLLTAADEVRARGVVAAALDPVGAGICLLVAAFFYVRPLYRMQLTTLPDVFRRSFGGASELWASGLMVPVYFGWIAAQFLALAHLLELFFGIPVDAGLWLVAIVGTGYTIVGGMWAVTLTDAVQMALVVVGLFVITWTVLANLGGGDPATGLSTLGETIEPERLTLIPTETLAEFTAWLSVICAGALGNIPSQDIFQRVFSSRSENVAFGACLIAGVAYLVLGAMPVVLGLVGYSMLGPEGTSTLPWLASQFLHPVGATLFVVTLLSAVLSTIDSAMLAPATVLAENVFARNRQGHAPLSWHRWSVLLVSAISLGFAFAGESAYALLESGYELGMVSLLIPLTVAIYVKVPNPRGALASMVAGTVVWGTHYGLGWETFADGAAGPLPLGLTCTAISLAAYFATPKPPAQW